MKRSLLMLLSFSLIGCSTTGTLKAYLEERKDPLVYLYTSEKAGAKKNGTVSIGSFTVNDVLPPETNITQISQSVMPLIIWNTWNQKFQSQLGSPQIAGDYKQFMKDSFMRELQRSGRREVVGEKGELTMDVRIKSVEMSAPISQRGQFLFLVFIFAIGTETTAGPVDVSVKADVRVIKNGTELLAREIQGRASIGLLRGSGNHFVSYHTTAMTEGLSLAIKDLNEGIVWMVNRI